MEASYKGDWITSVASETPDSDRWVVAVDVLSQPHGAHNERFEGLRIKEGSGVLGHQVR